jgi:hypothetical protein
MLSRSCCLHQARVCLSLARLTADANVRHRLEELAINFAERIGGEDDLDIAQIFAGIRPSKIKEGNSNCRPPLQRFQIQNATQSGTSFCTTPPIYRANPLLASFRVNDHGVRQSTALTNRLESGWYVG